MTIGIAASGPRAGAASVRALEVAETVGTGASGGFVSFVAIGDGGGRMHNRLDVSEMFVSKPTFK